MEMIVFEEVYFCQRPDSIRFKLSDGTNSGPKAYPHDDPENFRPANNWTWEWYGTNEETDCGLTLSQAVRWDNGEWSYSFAEASGKMFLYVKGRGCHIN